MAQTLGRRSQGKSSVSRVGGGEDGGPRLVEGEQQAEAGSRLGLAEATGCLGNDAVTTL